MCLNLAAKELHDHFRNGQAKTHASLVDVFGGQGLAEETKELAHVLLSDADACIRHLHHEVAFNNTGFHSDSPSHCELDCVANQVEEDLLESLLVGEHHSG